LYGGPFCILSIVDNRTFKRITYQVLSRDPKRDDIMDGPAHRRVRTNNHVERTNRLIRFLEKVRYKWRRRRTLVRFVVLTLDRIWSAWTITHSLATDRPQANRARQDGKRKGKTTSSRVRRWWCSARSLIFARCRVIDITHGRMRKRLTTDGAPMPRPAPRFRDFVGQKPVVDLLRRQLEGAQDHNEPFPHALFHGPSGVGKSLLAQALAAEMGTDVVEAMGYDDRLSIGTKLTRLHDHDILLVDEAHRLGHAEQEILIEAIDRGSIPAPTPKSADRPVGNDGRVALRPWTLILATDQPGVLLNALHKRIVLEIALDYYPLNELKEIVEAMAMQANLLLSPQAARLVAESSSGLPRRAKQLLLNLRLFHPHSENRQLGLSEVREFLDAYGYDEAGLSRQECRYLEAVARLGVGSLESIAQALGCDRAFVRRQIEPALLRRGLVRITPSGRQLTDSGRERASRRQPSD